MKSLKSLERAKRTGPRTNNSASDRTSSVRMIAQLALELLFLAGIMLHFSLSCAGCSCKKRFRRCADLVCLRRRRVETFGEYWVQLFERRLRAPGGCF